MCALWHEKKPAASMASRLLISAGSSTEVSNTTHTYIMYVYFQNKTHFC